MQLMLRLRQYASPMAPNVKTHLWLQDAVVQQNKLNYIRIFMKKTN